MKLGYSRPLENLSMRGGTVNGAPTPQTQLPTRRRIPSSRNQRKGGRPRLFPFKIFCSMRDAIWLRKWFVNLTFSLTPGIPLSGERKGFGKAWVPLEKSRFSFNRHWRPSGPVPSVDQPSPFERPRAFTVRWSRPRERWRGRRSLREPCPLSARRLRSLVTVFCQSRSGLPSALKPPGPADRPAGGTRRSQPVESELSCSCSTIRSRRNLPVAGDHAEGTAADHGDAVHQPDGTFAGNGITPEDVRPAVAVEVTAAGD